MERKNNHWIPIIRHDGHRHGHRCFNGCIRKRFGHQSIHIQFIFDCDIGVVRHRWVGEIRQAQKKHSQIINKQYMTITHDFEGASNDTPKDSFDQFIEELAQQDQPQCSIDKPEECDSCGA